MSDRERPERKPDALAWIDVETTDLNPKGGELLEVSARITGMDANEEHARFHSIILPAGGIVLRRAEQVGTFSMHIANGLMESALSFGEDPDEVAHNLYEFLSDEASLRTLHPAGTNVDFDLAWINEKLAPFIDMPSPFGEPILSHRKLDVTAIRLAAAAAGADPYTADRHETKHRSDDCLDRDIVEYRDLFQAMQEGFDSQIPEI